jgi:hypothetical protein
MALILVEPVVAELGTVNDPETGVCFRKGFAPHNSPSSSKSPFPSQSNSICFWMVCPVQVGVIIIVFSVPMVGFVDSCKVAISTTRRRVIDSSNWTF